MLRVGGACGGFVLLRLVVGWVFAAAVSQWGVSSFHLSSVLRMANSRRAENYVSHMPKVARSGYLTATNIFHSSRSASGPESLRLRGGAR